ncbi:MAG: hypothetical protein JRJ27_04965 [Deltaproteobacteria bacterium]|nr:hypothetical protein [Deltaproteobacteria bacterium]
MVKSKQVIIVLSVIVIGIILFFFFFQSEERQVRKRFKTFAQTASKRVEDSQLIVAGKIPEKGIATAISTVRILGKVKRGEEYVEENHEIECTFNKIEDEWVFVNVELIDVLRK